MSICPLTLLRNIFIFREARGESPILYLMHYAHHAHTEVRIVFYSPLLHEYIFYSICTLITAIYSLKFFLPFYHKHCSTSFTSAAIAASTSLAAHRTARLTKPTTDITLTYSYNIGFNILFHSCNTPAL